MSIIEKINLLVESLPRTCLYCRFGEPVVWHTESWLDTFMCSKHMVEGLRSKKITLTSLERMRACREGKLADICYAPMLAADEGCDGWEPVKPFSRKFKMLDLFGMFNESNEEPCCKETCL